jgi:hypothetical protein
MQHQKSRSRNHATSKFTRNTSGYIENHPRENTQDQKSRVKNSRKNKITRQKSRRLNITQNKIPQFPKERFSHLPDLFIAGYSVCVKLTLHSSTVCGK